MSRLRTVLRSAAVVGFVAGVSVTAHGADMVTKAPPVAANPCAVDGVNGKLDGFGGRFEGASLYGGSGSISAPLGCQFGIQVDGTAASLDSRFLGNVAGHLFTRDPRSFLLGAYADYTWWNQVSGIRVAHYGAEGELYFGRWTLQGVAGVETGNTAVGTLAGLITTFNFPTRFFDQVNLAFYPIENLKLYIGHRYLAGQHAAAFGGEWGIPMNGGAMAALFVEGRAGEGNFHGVWGGLRIYFGQHDKSLIRRHREDDPQDWTTNIGSTGNSNQTPPPSTPTTPSCTPPAGQGIAGAPCID